MKFGVPMEIHTPMAVNRSQLKHGLEFQYGGHLFSQNGSSNIRAVD